MSEVQVDVQRELIITRRQLADANRSAAQAEAVAGQLHDELRAAQAELVDARAALTALGAYPGVDPKNPPNPEDSQHG